MSSDELKKNFSLERVAKSGAMFDVKKLEWMNGHYIRQASLGHIANSLLDYWQEFPTEGIKPLPDRETLIRIVPLIHQRIKTLKDATPLISFFFQSTIHYDINELVQKNMDTNSTKLALLETSSLIESMENFDASTIENTLRNLATDIGIKPGQLFGSIRVATTGLKVAPPLFETLEVLGKKRSLAAIDLAVEKLQATSVQESES
jgi:glutamyl-tRNA synthetase